MLEEAVAVELRDVGPKTAADYLTRIQLDPPPPRWRELTDRLRNAPDSPIARALSNPLTLTLIRDTYRSGDSIGELLDFCATGRNITREDVENYLLDRVLPQAYARRPGAPKSRYTLETAQHTLQLIASRMHRDSPDPQKPTRDLAWWCIPTWIGSLPRTLTIGIVSELVVWLGCLFSFGGLPSFGFGLEFALCTGFGGLLGAWLANKKPPQTVPVRWRFVLSRPSLVFILGLVFGYMFAFGVVYRIAFWLLVVILVVILACIAFWLLVGLTIWLAGNTRHQTALMRWRTVHTRPAVVFVIGFGFGFLGPFGAAALGGLVGVELGLGLVGLLGLALGLGGVGGFEREHGEPPGLPSTPGAAIEQSGSGSGSG